MLKRFAFFSLLVLGVSPVWAYQPLEVFPNILFTENDVGVRFSFSPETSKEQIPPVFVTLVEMNGDTQTPKYRWELRDDGTLGDKLTGDGIYSRKIQFKELRPKTLHFAILDTQNIPTTTATLEIRAHPTFIDIVRDAWKKIINR